MSVPSKIVQKIHKLSEDIINHLFDPTLLTTTQVNVKTQISFAKVIMV